LPCVAKDRGPHRRPELQAGVLLMENQAPRAPTLSLHYASNTIVNVCNYKQYKVCFPFQCGINPILKTNLSRWSSDRTVPESRDNCLLCHLCVVGFVTRAYQYDVYTSQCLKACQNLSHVQHPGINIQITIFLVRLHIHISITKAAGTDNWRVYLQKRKIIRNCTGTTSHINLINI